MLRVAALTDAPEPDAPELDAPAPGVSSSASPGGARPARVYRASPRIRRQLLLVWALVMLLPGALLVVGLATGDRSGVAVGILVGLLISAVMLPIFWLAAWHYPRLTLAEGGVELKQLGLRLATEWDNVAAVRRSNGLALVLREPMTVPGAATQAAFGGTAVAGSPLYTAEVQDLIDARRYMPLKPFGYWLDHGDLAEELVARAPWLATDVAAAVAEQLDPPRRHFLADAEGQPLPRRKLLALVAVIALAIGLGIVAELGPTGLSVGITQGLSALAGLALAGFALLNFVAAARCFRIGQWWPGLLWAALAVMMTLVALSIAGSLLPV